MPPPPRLKHLIQPVIVYTTTSLLGNGAVVLFASHTTNPAHPDSILTALLAAHALALGLTVLSTQALLRADGTSLAEVCGHPRCLRVRPTVLLWAAITLSWLIPILALAAWAGPSPGASPDAPASDWLHLTGSQALTLAFFGIPIVGMAYPAVLSAYYTGIVYPYLAQRFTHRASWLGCATIGCAIHITATPWMLLLPGAAIGTPVACAWLRARTGNAASSIVLAQAVWTTFLLIALIYATRTPA
ncbi:hypothetical protein [Corynebacterium aquilae]|uniref:Uncharacterized protein n=1 Tax=Corynebacterium aquilae DSM 44791 TaxID=1431546 RepID=A0A1L7CI06_9CORY|nr:hypothetical protein [Corynebacterium aquilae]APT85487.1 hypothetical protein CAQU_10975 [Corynebacterium aquilae DSM 44791]